MQVLDIRVCGHVVGDLNTGGGGLPNHLYDTAPLLCPLLPVYVHHLEVDNVHILVGGDNLLHVCPHSPLYISI